ncbi:MAG: exodeoxyribonuclease VII small subunit [Eubacteriales bacterium]|nr:exodeoxyribonuclease VII small subunit [Eubacteriales bacterium]
MAKDDFEKNLRNLEAIAAKMKSPDITLEESIASYEEGMKYYAVLSGILSQAERRIQTIENEERKESN